MNDVFQTALRIPMNHPTLPGHFPGHPVVPGVVLLERVAAALRAWRGEDVARIDAKFLQPLLPDADAVVELQVEGDWIRFEVRRTDGAPLARGTLGSRRGARRAEAGGRP